MVKMRKEMVTKMVTNFRVKNEAYDGRRLVIAGTNGAKIVMWSATAAKNSLYLPTNVPSCRWCAADIAEIVAAIVHGETDLQSSTPLCAFP
jgi:hypothetical protein